MTTSLSNPSLRPANAGSLDVRLLGLVDFDSAVALQEWLVYQLSGRRDVQGTLLLCEHPPVVTIGREGTRAQVVADDSELDAGRMPIRWMSRSGGAVLHSPGQLAIYLLLPLDRLQLGLAEFRERMEAAVLNVCHEMRVPAKRLPQGPGLWSRGGQVAHFGATVKSWVTQHGMWVNVCNDPGFLRMTRSDAGRHRAGADASAVETTTGIVTGVEDAAESVQEEASREFSIDAEHRVTSLQAQLLRRIPMPTVREATMRHLAAAFGYQTVHTFTGHPQLVRTRQRVCVQA